MLKVGRVLLKEGFAHFTAKKDIKPEKTQGSVIVRRFFDIVETRNSRVCPSQNSIKSLSIIGNILFKKTRQLCVSPLKRRLK